MKQYLYLPGAMSINLLRLLNVTSIILSSVYCNTTIDFYDNNVFWYLHNSKVPNKISKSNASKIEYSINLGLYINNNNIHPLILSLTQIKTSSYVVFEFQNCQYNRTKRKDLHLPKTDQTIMERRLTRSTPYQKL